MKVLRAWAVFSPNGWPIIESIAKTRENSLSSIGASLEGLKKERYTVRRVRITVEDEDARRAH